MSLQVFLLLHTSELSYKQMLSASFTSSTFTVRVNGNSTNVPGVLWLTSGNTTINFAPSFICPPTTTYVTTLTTGVKDVAGNAMTMTKTWSFTTM